MPAGKGKKKGKKPKLSKAEKERLKREEAERKALEEEEARIRAEQEAKEREERERQEQEERRKLEEQERARNQAEIDELNEIIQGNKEKLMNLKRQKRIEEKWERYMLCDGRPDPTSKKELNTFMNLWKDETEFKEFHKVLEECELTLELIEELNKCLVLDEDLTEENIASYKESIGEMYALLDVKLDEATMWLLKKPGQNINIETDNLETVKQSGNFKACVWGNTAKNPRVKIADFPTEGFTVEIPKSLGLADVAIRLLYRSYDTLSSRCSTFLPKVKKNMEILPATETDAVDEEKAENVNETELALPKTPDAPSQLSDVPREKTSSRKSRKSASRSSALSAKESKIESKNSETKNSEGKKDEEVKNEELVEPDDKVAEQELKILGDEEDDLLDENVVDLRSFSPMGAVAFIELLELPPQQHKASQWLMQQIVSTELKRLNLIASNPGPQGGKSLNESQHLEQESRPSGSAKSNTSIPSTQSVGSIKPIAITLKAPDDVILFEKPQLARWDESCCHWKLDGFEDVMYEDESRTISFKTANFGPIAMIQDLYLNMPFQSWELRPIQPNNCVLAVIAVNVDIEIEIKESQCCLRKPLDYEALKGLLNVWLDPEKLIKRMKACGINIFPLEDGEKYVSICKKDPAFVNSVYEQLALSSSSYAYCWSKWNGVEECPEDAVVIGAVEWCRDNQPSEDDYNLYMASTRICYKLAIGEFDENFSIEVAANTQMHPNLFHMVQDGGSETAKQRISETSFEFADCVSQLVKATNFLIFS